MRRTTKDQIEQTMSLIFTFGTETLIVGFDPDLVQIHKDEIRQIIRDHIGRPDHQAMTPISDDKETMLACTRAINGLIYARMDEVRGSEYEAYYVEAFGKPGVPVLADA